MGYKVFDEKNETFFKYKPFKKIRKSLDLKIKKDNPFEALKQLDLKWYLSFLIRIKKNQK